MGIELTRSWRPRAARLIDQRGAATGDRPRCVLHSRLFFSANARHQWGRESPVLRATPGGQRTSGERWAACIDRVGGGPARAASSTDGYGEGCPRCVQDVLPRRCGFQAAICAVPCPVQRGPRADPGWREEAWGYRLHQPVGRPGRLHPQLLPRGRARGAGHVVDAGHGGRGAGERHHACASHPQCASGHQIRCVVPGARARRLWRPRRPRPIRVPLTGGLRVVRHPDVGGCRVCRGDARVHRSPPGQCAVQRPRHRRPRVCGRPRRLRGHRPGPGPVGPLAPRHHVRPGAGLRGVPRLPGPHRRARHGRHQAHGGHRLAAPHRPLPRPPCLGRPLGRWLWPHALGPLPVRPRHAPARHLLARLPRGSHCQRGRLGQPQPQHFRLLAVRTQPEGAGRGPGSGAPPHHDRLCLHRPRRHLCHRRALRPPGIGPGRPDGPAPRATAQASCLRGASGGDPVHQHRCQPRRTRHRPHEPLPPLRDLCPGRGGCRPPWRPPAALEDPPVHLRLHPHVARRLLGPAGTRRWHRGGGLLLGAGEAAGRGWAVRERPGEPLLLRGGLPPPGNGGPRDWGAALAAGLFGRGGCRAVLVRPRHLPPPVQRRVDGRVRGRQRRLLWGVGPGQARPRLRCADRSGVMDRAGSSDPLALPLAGRSRSRAADQ